MTKKAARKLMSRKLDRLVALQKCGIRALSKAESKLVKKCTSVLLKEED